MLKLLNVRKSVVVAFFRKECNQLAFTVAQCNERLQIWLAAEEKIASGQSYTIDNRRLDRANLAQVREQIKFWQSELAKAQAAATGRGRRRTIRIVPRDL